MEWIDSLFVGGSVKDVATIVYSLRHHIPVFNVFCICLFGKEKKHMEILSSRELCKERYQRKDVTIVGIAYGREEAIDLFCYMAEEAVKAGRSLEDVEEWIQ